MPLTIYAVGDIMLGEQPLCYGFGVESVTNIYGASYLFHNVSPLLSDGDIFFGNLESPIFNRKNHNDFKESFFRADPYVVAALKKGRFNALSVANNHIMEHGKNGFDSTVSILKENNILPVGIRDRIDVITVKGIKIAILAYSFIEDYCLESLYNKIQSENKIIEDIQSIRESVDIVIVALHWGYEYIPCPSPDQMIIGRKLINCGADIILGGHPHVVQGYEFFKGRPIFYSLGNFIFDMTFINNTRRSVIAKIQIDLEPNIINIEMIPIICDFKRYYPKIINGDESEKFLITQGNGEKYNNNTSEYLKRNQGYINSAKNDMKIHFIKSLYRYPPKLSFHIIKSFLEGKVRKIA